MRISFFIPIAPVAQGRAKTNFNSRSIYDPAKSRKFKEDIALIAKMERTPCWEKIAMGMKLEFIMPRIKSLPKRKVIPHIKKPDLTNMTKGIEDALESICYKNDSAIIHETLDKRYALPGEEPGIRLELWRIES